MSFMNKVKDLLSKHDDKVHKAVDKAASTVDTRTGGKYSDQISSGSEKAKDAVSRSEDDPADGTGRTGQGPADETDGRGEQGRGGA